MNTMNTMNTINTTFRLIITIFLATCFCRCAATSQNDTVIAQASDRNAELASELNDKAVKLINNNKLDEAIKILNKSLDADDMFAPTHNNLGYIYLKKKQFYNAACSFEAVIKLNPLAPEPRYNLGLVYERAGRLDEAVDRYDQAHRFSPANPQFLAALINARLKRGDRDKEITQLLQELVLKETRPEWREWAEKKNALFKSDNGRIK